MVDKLGDEVELIENDCLDRLYSKVTQQGWKARCDTAAGDVDLEIIGMCRQHLYCRTSTCPPNTKICWLHSVCLNASVVAIAILCVVFGVLESRVGFSSRFCQGDRIYSSAYYWKKRMDTIQHCVCMENDDGESLDTGSSFGFDS
ncbi:unnamed protein product [Heligmosomoides polygyrus]|uniref:Tetraspanin n=1 Tax=Heligmosomoides polygyrus TaxID=6339 RepID=A0A183FC53_HELPZ|nr:unnamed protein product [Heligmosomoides polygyrus]